MNKKEVECNRICEGIFYLAICLETLFVLLDKSSYIIQHETWCFRFTFLLFSAKIALTKYSAKEWICMVSFILLGVISWCYTDREEIVRIVALVAACKGMDRRNIIKLVLYETLIGSAIIVALAFFGIYGAVSVEGLFRGGGVITTRYCFGMGHPNAFHCMLLMVMLLFLALYEKQMKWYGYVLAFFVNIGLGYYTESRTGVLVATAMIVFAVILHYGKNVRGKKTIYVLAEICILMCVMVSVFTAKVGVGHPVLLRIDRTLNGRLQWAGSDGAIRYWSLFSNELNQNYFDMGYVRLFYWYGIIPALIFLAVIAITVWKCRELKAYDVFLILMTFVAYSLIEAHAVSTYIGRNYMLFCIGTILPAIMNGTTKENVNEYSVINIGKVSVEKWKRTFK